MFPLESPLERIEGCYQGRCSGWVGVGARLQLFASFRCLYGLYVFLFRVDAQWGSGGGGGGWRHRCLQRRMQTVGCLHAACKQPPQRSW
jgi:hypothetical protein